MLGDDGTGAAPGSRDRVWQRWRERESESNIYREREREGERVGTSQGRWSQSVVLFCVSLPTLDICAGFWPLWGSAGVPMWHHLWCTWHYSLLLTRCGSTLLVNEWKRAKRFGSLNARLVSLKQSTDESVCVQSEWWRLKEMSTRKAYTQSHALSHSHIHERHEYVVSFALT